MTREGSLSKVQCITNLSNTCLIHKYLESNLTTRSFSKITAAGSTPELMNSIAMGFWQGLQYQKWNSLLWSRP